MRRLAHQAQVSTRTLYNLYGAKEDILFALMSEAMATLEDITHESAESDPISRSRALTRLSLDRLCEDEALYRNLLRGTQLDPGRSREPLLMVQMRTLHEEALRDAIAAGQLHESFSPRVLAHQLVLTYGQGVRLWANGVFDRHALRVHALHGWALILLAAATDETRLWLVAEVASLHPEAERVVARLDRMFSVPSSNAGSSRVRETGELGRAGDVALAGSA